MEKIISQFQKDMLAVEQQYDRFQSALEELKKGKQLTQSVALESQVFNPDSKLPDIYFSNRTVDEKYQLACEEINTGMALLLGVAIATIVAFIVKAIQFFVGRKSTAGDGPSFEMNYELTPDADKGYKHFIEVGEKDYPAVYARFIESVPYLEQLGGKKDYYKNLMKLVDFMKSSNFIKLARTILDKTGGLYRECLEKYCSENAAPFSTEDVVSLIRSKTSDVDELNSEIQEITKIITELNDFKLNCINNPNKHVPSPHEFLQFARGLQHAASTLKKDYVLLAGYNSSMESHLRMLKTYVEGTFNHQIQAISAGVVLDDKLLHIKEAVDRQFVSLTKTVAMTAVKAAGQLSSVGTQTYNTFGKAYENFEHVAEIILREGKS